MKHLNTLLIVLAVGMSPVVQAGGDTAAGKIIATEKCQACHGVEGNSDNVQFPRLAGQYADYLARALTDYQTGARANPIMSGQVSGLSRQDIKNVSAWFAGQTGLVTAVQPKTVSR